METNERNPPVLKLFCLGLQRQYEALEKCIMQGDRDYMTNLINYCVNVVGGGNQHIKLDLMITDCLDDDLHLYELFIWFPLDTKFEDRQTAYIRSHGWRISGKIELRYDDGLKMMKMTIPVCPAKHEPRESAHLYYLSMLCKQAPIK